MEFCLEYERRRGSKSMGEGRMDGEKFDNRKGKESDERSAGAEDHG